MRRFAFFVILSLLAAAPAFAQQGTAEIRGRIMDAQDAALPGVTVVVRNQETGMFRETVATSEGTYFVSGIVPGRYEVTATLQGFSTFLRRDVVLEVGKTTSLDIKLAIGNVTEQVTVVGETRLVDTTSKEVGGNITSRELLSLPSVNRNFVGFVGLLPGIVPSISNESFGSDSVTANGQDARNNNYMLDGAGNNDDVIGQRAGMQARTAIESVAEFQVITNQFDAEFGRTAGAIINAVTKQGTNRYSGSAFVYEKDASLTAKDYFAKKNNLSKPDTQEQQFGGTLGGPIVQNKAHFFASLERVRIDSGNTINLPARPELNTTTATETRVWNTVIRLDHQISANNTWGVRWLREDSPQFNQIIGTVSLAASREEADVDQTVVGTWTSVLGNSRVNSLRVGWTQEDVAFANPCYNGNGRNQGACLPTLAFQTFTDQQSNVAQARVNDSYQIEDTFSWFVPGKRGDHDIKTGLQYNYARAKNVNEGNLNGTFSFGRSSSAFNAADPSTYPDRFSIRVGGPSLSTVTSKYFAAFLQDNWKVNPRLTISLGVRYDVESLPIPEIDNPAFSVSSESPVDKNNIQPRLGFAYDLHGDGSDVVRGGYGRFYDKTHFELINGIFNNTVFAPSFTATFPINAADAGPRNGRLPTDPFLVNGPTVNTALLASMFPAGSNIRNTGTVIWDNPNRVSPHTDQITVGYSRQLRPNVGISADYVHAISRDLLMYRDLNPRLRATTSVTSPAVRQGSAALTAARTALTVKYPGLTSFGGAVLMPENVGETDYDALMLQVEKRFSNNWSARLAYTLSSSTGNTTGSGLPTSGFQLFDDLNLDLNQGPTNQDRRHNVVFSGALIVPRTGGMTFGWVARALSGGPFSLTNGNLDPDRNGSQSEPLAAGEYSGTGEDAFTVNNKNERNGAYGPNFFKLDVRAGYRFQVSDRTIDAFVEVFNLTNRVNFDNPSGNQASPNFLRLTGFTASTTPRLVQLGFRIGF